MEKGVKIGIVGKIFLISYALIMIIGIIVDFGTVTEEDIIRETGKKNAINYVVQKYGFEPEVISVECLEYSIFAGSIFPVLRVDTSPDPTGDVCVTMKHDNKRFDVYINGEEETIDGCDNYQAKEIRDDFRAKMEEILNCEIVDFHLCLGEFYNVNETPSEWGFVKEYYDGNNLAEVLESCRYNEAKIFCFEGDLENIPVKEVTDSVGESTKCTFLKIRDEEAYNDLELKEVDSSEMGIKYNMVEQALFVEEYAVVYFDEKAYGKYEINTYGKINYLIEGGTYCNFIESSEDASKWKWYGSEDARQVFDTYEIDTDAEVVHIWINRKKVIDPYFAVQYYDENNNITQKSYKDFTKSVGDEKYIYTDFYIKNKQKLQFSVFSEY